MLYGRPAAGALGFSLNPFHYVKKVVVASYDIDKAIRSNKLVQAGAGAVANAYVPGSGAAVQAGLQVTSGGGGGTVATPAAAQSAAPAPGPSDNASAPAHGHGGGHGDQMFGMPKKYVLIGGGVLGAVVLLSLLRR